MTAYRKKPVVIEATQWFKNGDHPEDDCDMFDYPDEKGNIFQRPGEGKVVRYYRHPDATVFCEQCGKTHHSHGWIDTLEQGHRVCPGDWIITGVKGERYPCKPDVFEQTYELAVDLTADPVLVEKFKAAVSVTPLSELIRDGRRYRWLRARPSLIGWDWWTPDVPRDVNITPEFMDAAIDAAIVSGRDAT